MKRHSTKAPGNDRIYGRGGRQAAASGNGRADTAILLPQPLPGVTLLSARYRRRRFRRHTHDGYALGVIDAGALGYAYRGAHVVAPAGAVNLVVPGEPHDGHAVAEEGWRYRMFYFEPQVLADVAAQMADGPRDLPWFPAGVVHDSVLADLVGRTHRCLSDPASSGVARESALLGLLSAFIRRHADDPPPEKAAVSAAGPLSRARDYIHDHSDDAVSLSDLARTAGLSPYHLIRAFRRAFGLTPHAYLVQTRVAAARGRIDAGVPLAEAALASGFADQSHLTRHFGRIVGLSPGAYRNFVQSSDGAAM